MGLLNKETNIRHCRGGALVHECIIVSVKIGKYTLQYIGIIYVLFFTIFIFSCLINFTLCSILFEGFLYLISNFVYGFKADRDLMRAS